MPSDTSQAMVELALQGLHDEAQVRLRVEGIAEWLWIDRIQLVPNQTELVNIRLAADGSDMWFPLLRLYAVQFGEEDLR